MSMIRQTWHDIRMCVAAAVRQWRECRHLRNGGNPDVMPF